LANIGVARGGVQWVPPQQASYPRAKWFNGIVYIKTNPITEGHAVGTGYESE